MSNNYVWKFGVSPAWFISKFGEGFSMDQMISQLPTLKSLGFCFWQPEAFRKEDLASWTPSEIRRLNSVQSELMLSPSQCVAHFLMGDFESPKALDVQAGLPYFRDLLDKASLIDGLTTICIPLPPFSALPHVDFLLSYKAIQNYLSVLLDLIRSIAFELTIEIMPGSLIQSTEGFLRLWKDLGAPSDLGFCLDSGHVWGGREHIVSLPQRLGKRLKTTHLGDHDGSTLKKQVPGTGTIPYKALFQEMKRWGYEGSLDIEFVCETSLVEEEYLQGLSFLKSIVSQI